MQAELGINCPVCSGNRDQEHLHREGRMAQKPHNTQGVWSSPPPSGGQEESRSGEESGPDITEWPKEGR